MKRDILAKLIAWKNNEKKEAFNHKRRQTVW